MNEVRFSIPGNPFGKQRPRFAKKGGFVKPYTPEKTEVYENLVKWYYQKEVGFMFPDDSMIDIEIIAFYEIPKSTSKKKRQLMLDKKLRPTKKPDWDNVGKIICDSLNKIAYRDDAMVVDAIVRKFYSEQPRVEVTMREIGGVL